MKPVPARIARSQGRPWTDLLVAGLLALLTLILYWPVSAFDLITYDDPEYITWNLEIQGGLSLQALRWAFSTLYAGNWHPLTWVSYMVDYQLFGGSPGQLHLTNLWLHTANTLLCLWLFRRMTGALWPSALVAGLFALHPLHVESVAWVCERKDVLSTFFALLALLAYYQYAVSGRPEAGPGVQRPKPKASPAPGLGFTKPWYWAAVALYACSLMSKPMLVTLPFLLLLLDFWPLQRLSLSPVHRKRVAALLLEKLPFVVLALGDSVVTYLAQQRGGAVVPVELLPLAARLANASMGFWHYLRTACWPASLSISYPATFHWPPWQPLTAAVLFLVLSALVLARHRRAYLVTGWFWFLGTLVPIIGLLQVGAQTVADRFMYFPLLGLGVCAAWGAVDLVRSRPSLKALLLLATLALLTCCAALTRRQIGFWKDTLTLFDRALAVNTNNFVAHGQLGLALSQLGRHDEAIEHFRGALRLNPLDATAHVGLAASLGNQGRLDDAAAHASTALELQPDSPEAHDCLGVALQLQNRTAEAEAHFARAVQLRPSFADARNHWAFALLQQGKTDDAIVQLQEALRFKPDSTEFQQRLAYALGQKGRSNPPN